MEMPHVESSRIPGAAARLVAALALSFLSACAAMTASNSMLDGARTEFENARSTEDVFLLAGPELEDASVALNAAEKAWRWHADKSQVDRLAEVVNQRVAFARFAAAQRVLELRHLGIEARPQR